MALLKVRISTILSGTHMLVYSVTTAMPLFYVGYSWRKQTANIIGWNVDTCTGNRVIYLLWHLIISCVCLVTDIQTHKESLFVLVSFNFICVLIDGI